MLGSWIDLFVNYCIAKKIVSPADSAWLKYGLEKRIYTLLVAIPFWIVAVILTDAYTAIAFFICFYCLRRRTNGFHANSIWLCFIFSLLFEILFLGILSPQLNTTANLVLSIISTTIIFYLAPYNHPNMHLSANEIAACQTSSRFLSCGILLCIIVFSVVDMAALVSGCSLGLAMAACLLCLAYIIKGGKKLNENKTKSH